MDERDWPVEFRYVERLEPVPGLDNVAHVVRALQVRYRDSNTGVYYVNKDDRYTAWQDVPVVPVDRTKAD
jgi:hypothetical protein